MGVKPKKQSAALEPLWETEARAGPKLQARAHLLEAAATAFRIGGYAATTLDDVAALTGMTKGQIYHYYRSKIDLYFDVVVGAFFILNEAVRPIAEQGDIDPGVRLYQIAYKHSLVLMETYPFQKVALEAAQHRFQPGSSARQSRAMERMLQFRAEYEDMIVAVLKDGQVRNLFEPGSASVAAKAILGTLNWMLVWYDPKLSPTDAARHSIAERTARLVVSAVCTKLDKRETLKARASATSASMRQLSRN